MSKELLVVFQLRDDSGKQLITIDDIRVDHMMLRDIDEVIDEIEEKLPEILEQVVEALEQ